MFNLPYKKEKGHIQSEKDVEFIEDVIALLKKEPRKFSAIASGNRIADSVRHLKKDIFIVIKTGEIISPIEPTMTSDQKNEIMQLLTPIVRRDEKMLVKEILGDE